MAAPFLNSTVGKKIIVAITGLVMFGFVVGHLAGNLQIFFGPEKLNAYSHFLHTQLPLLWGSRIALLVSIALHVVFTIQLTALNRASRPVAYEVSTPVQASVSSRFMIWSGMFLGFYILFHILHLTTGTVHSEFDRTDVYANVVIGFSSLPVTAIYILAMVALGFHLHHGVFSLFQTLGLNHPRYNSCRRGLALAAGWLIPIGYISIPAAVLLGILVIR